MTNPLLLLHLLPRHYQSLGVADDDEVTAVGDGVEDWFVLALEEGGDAGGETADGRTGSVKEVPSFAVSQSCLHTGCHKLHILVVLTWALLAEHFAIRRRIPDRPGHTLEHHELF